MLSAARALTMSAGKSDPMPRIEGAEALYDIGWAPHHGELMMVAGRPGAMKSALTMWITEQWGLETLYFSADMTPHTSASRIAAMKTGMTVDSIDKALKYEEKGITLGRDDILAELRKSKISFAFGPITFRGIQRELDAWVEIYNRFPEVIVIDNLINVEGCASSYEAQMMAMDAFAQLKTEMNINVIVLHHASDKQWDGSRSWEPPSRQQVKGGMAETPECTLTVAVDPRESMVNVAIVKQRNGRADETGRSYVGLQVWPEYTTFGRVGSEYVSPLDMVDDEPPFG